MFVKLEKRSWIKIEVERGRSTQECFQGLREDHGDAALPYRAGARWVKAFREGRDLVQDNLQTGRPHVENDTVQLLAFMLDADCRWTAHELAVHRCGSGGSMRDCHEAGPGSIPGRDKFPG